MSEKNENNMYDILSDIYKEDDGTISEQGQKNLNEILGKSEKRKSNIKIPSMGDFSNIFKPIMKPFIKLDALIFRAPPKMTNAYNRRGSWIR